MSEHAAGLAHQFDDLEQQHEAGTLGMWLFLATEIMFFGGLFAAFTVYNRAFGAAFGEASRHLDVAAGAVNTAVLLTSSLTMALAVRAAQMNRRRATALLLLATIVLGAVFLGVKFFEYHHKYEEGLIPGAGFHAAETNPETNPAHMQLFFLFYFTMTGMHAFHMIIGIPMIAIVAGMALRGRFSAAHHAPVETVGLYWHFVDIVWVFLFPLLYLVDRV